MGQLLELDPFASNRFASVLSSLLRAQLARDEHASLTIGVLDGGSNLVFEIRHPSAPPSRAPGLESVFASIQAGQDAGFHFLRLLPCFAKQVEKFMVSKRAAIRECLLWKSREQLLSDLKRSNDALRKHSEELEEVVAERTAELQ